MAPGTRTSFAARSNSARKLAASNGCKAAGAAVAEVVDAGAAEDEDAGAVEEMAVEGGPELQETVAATAATMAAVTVVLTETCLLRIMATPVERY
ncbi:hypothetical protein [Arthrobacter sp. cf158]|uniref:hypothetical protein n=1 Tax=Arthrobacter sp. cf158 TaxID=1761744 RepID=UPI0020C84065|nr:hypothetical protein [Arthrobacter sp. cf158]